MSFTVRAVAYYRMSTHRQEESIERQQEWALRTARTEGVELVREFDDKGIPGDAVLTRPGFLSMLDFCDRQAKEGNPIGAIVCWDLDRFSRANSIATNAVLAGLMDNGVTRVLTREGWTDLEDDMGRTLMNLKQDFGRAAYVKSMSANVAQQAVMRAKQGRWNGGRRPYGYTLGADGKLALGDARAVEAVRWMFGEAGTRETSLQRMADQLNAEGVPPPVGKSNAWTRDNVRTILRNPIYTGALHYNRLHFGKYHRIKKGDAQKCRALKTAKHKAKAVRNDPEDVIVIPDAHPALVDRETFDAVQQRLRGRWFAMRPGTVRRKMDWIFSGLLRCGDCGHDLWGRQAQKRTKEGRLFEWREYLCSNYMSRGRGECSYNHVLEPDILDKVALAIQRHFSDPALVAELREAIREQQQAKQREADHRGPTLRQRLTELSRLIDDGTEKLVKLPADLVEDVIVKIREWKGQRDQVRRQLRQIEATADTSAEDVRRTDRALARLKSLQKIVRGADVRDVREMMQGLIERVDLRFSQEDRGQRRFTRCEGGTIYLNPVLAVFCPALIELPIYAGQKIELPAW